VLRTTLTGTHALLTGEVETDVTLLLDAHGFGAALKLVEAKRRGERSELAADVSERWKREVLRAFEVLDDALTRSMLTEEPPNVREIEAWLVDLRRRGFGAS
jgi:hypothetical protein